MRTYTTRRCLRVAASLRPLMGKLRPLLLKLSPLCHRGPIRVLPFIHSIRTSRRRTASIVAMAIFMTTVLACRHLLHRPKGPCSLWCPYLAGSPVPDPRWCPRVVPINHACQSRVDLPVPCVANNTFSALLEQPPITFLENFRNPCWYEPLNITDWDNVNDTNPYTHNLFSCFSNGARRHFTYMAKIFHQGSHSHRQQQEKEEEEGEEKGAPQRLRCLPYFYIAGMPKSGSTDLFRKLMLHPDMVRPPMKEPHWWSKNRFGQRLNFTSSVPFEDYLDLFDRTAREIERRSERVDDITTTDDIMMDPSDSGDISTTSGDVNSKVYHPAVTMDASASTFWNNDEWWRLEENCGHAEPLFTNPHYIQRLTPQAKIIVILRNPTDRLFSDYLYFTKSNKSLTGFHEDVLLSIEKLTNCTDQRSLRSCIYDKHILLGKGKVVRLRIGVYHVYLSEWLSVFPRGQLLVLRTEDYSKKLRRTIRIIFRFLGLRPLTKEEEKRVLQLPKANTRRLEDRKLGSMLPETRQALQDFYHPHNQLLAQLLHDRQFLWKEEEEEASSAAQLSPGQEVEVPRTHGEVARRSTAYSDDSRSPKTTGDGTGTLEDSIGRPQTFVVNKSRDEYEDLYVESSEASFQNRTHSFVEMDGLQVETMTEDVNVDGDVSTSTVMMDGVGQGRSEDFETDDNDDFDADYYEEDTDYRYSDV